MTPFPKAFQLGLCLGARSLLYLFVLIALGQRACATLIVSDDFTAPNNTALLGRFPNPVDAPGTAYAGNGNVNPAGGPTGGTPYEADIQLNAARVGADAGLALNLGIGTPSRFQLSISFNISGNTQTQANDAHRGAGLGFFSSVAVGSGGSFHGFNNFTGLVVDITGSLRLIIGGANSGLVTTVAGFDPSVSHTLSFTVDTASGVGSISGISLDATSVLLSAPVDTFTVARTALAGFYNSSGNASDLADFDNFSVALVPEPSALAGLIALVVALGASTWWNGRRPNKKRQD